MIIPIVSAYISQICVEQFTRLAKLFISRALCLVQIDPLGKLDRFNAAIREGKYAKWRVQVAQNVARFDAERNVFFLGASDGFTTVLLRKAHVPNTFGVLPGITQLINKIVKRPARYEV